MTPSETTPSKRSKRGRWSTAERARLRELYGLRDNAVIARELKRPLDSVLRVARSLFPGEVKDGPWTANEVLNLKRYLGVSGPEVIARVLGRSVDEVQTQIFELGRIRHEGPWAREEISQFKHIYSRRTDEALARIFGRSEDEIRALALEHGLSKDKLFMKRVRGEGATRMPRWTSEELEILKATYASESNLALARRFQRSVKSVVSKAGRLGLKKSHEHLRDMGRMNVSQRYPLA